MSLPTGPSLRQARVVKALIPVVLACLIVALLLSVPAPHPAIAWSGDPALNTPICTTAGGQDRPVASGDGCGETIIAWQDDRGETGWDIYAQRTDSSGTIQWPDNGIAICPAVSDQTLPAAVSDGRGGAIVVWQDHRGSGYDIYAQRISGAGELLWTDNGVAVCTAIGDQIHPVVLTDGDGGAIVIWQDRRSGADSDIYAQRISAAGAAQWAADGCAICTAASDQASVAAVSDEDGGTIIAWQDIRGSGYDIYAQRLDASGIRLWLEDGVAVCAVEGHQINPVMVEDGSGGAIVAWPDGRSQTEYDVYSQRLDPHGAALWALNGVPVCTAAGDQVSLTATSDGCGGAIIGWQDARSGTDYDIYGQRVDSEGDIQWAIEGEAVCTAPEDQRSPVTVGGASGRVLVIWQDGRSGIDYDVYGQSIDPCGGTQWAVNGVPLSTAAGDQKSLSATGDGSGGAVVAWKDSRDAAGDIYVQRVRGSGVLSLSPKQPGNISPVDGEEGTSVTPTLKGSPFSPGEPGDAHAASQWRITTTPGDYTCPIFDSGPDSLCLLQTVLQNLTLNGNTTYYWQVRQRGSGGLWSSWSAETSFTTQNRPPNRPAGVSPGNDSSGIDLAPTLRSSAFSDPDVGDTHAASQWRMTTTAGDYTHPVFLTPELTTNLTQIVLDGESLSGNTAYYWQVRHKDSRGGWSAWSEEQRFFTLDRAPAQPVPISPSAGSSGMSRSPTLEASAFSDPDRNDAQAASQWQVSTRAGDYDSPVFDNTDMDGTDITGMAVSPALDPGTTYYWRVRYRDSHGLWSEWSAESSFTTSAEEQAETIEGMTAASWLYLAGIVSVAVSAAAAVAWRNARSSRTAARQAARSAPRGS